MMAPEARDPLKSRQVSGEMWLTSFTDLAALMLTFFVLQFSMSSIDVQHWQGLLEGFHGEKAAEAQLPATWSGDSIDASRQDSSPGRDLNYLESVLEEQLRAEGLGQLARLEHGPGVLRLLLPADVFLDRPGADAALLFAARQAVAAILDRLENDIELVAFAAVPDDKLRRFDWASVLTAARTAAESLAAAGFDRPIAASGRLLDSAAAAGAQQVEILIHAEAEEGR